MTRILLTNDDGLHAQGLAAARAILETFGRVVTVVPDREMSGASHALTLNRPLRITRVTEDVHVVNGTPTDCVNLALNRLLPEHPHLVFSGINRGTNVGYDITYSGTVAAAFEGALYGVRAVAVSIEPAGDLAAPAVASTIAAIVETVLHARRAKLLLNVNVPAGEIRGVRLTVQAHAGFRSEIIEKLDPRGNHYYWIGGQHAHDAELRPHSDIATLRAGFVSVTPLRLDFTDEGALEELRREGFVADDGEGRR